MFWTLYRQFLALLFTNALIVISIIALRTGLLQRTLRAWYIVDGGDQPTATRRIFRLAVLTGEWVVIFALAPARGSINAGASWVYLHNIVIFWCAIALPPLVVLCYVLLGLFYYRYTRRNIKQLGWEDVLGSDYRSRLREVWVVQSTQYANAVWFIFLFVVPALWGFGLFVSSPPRSDGHPGAGFPVAAAAFSMAGTSFVLVALAMRLADLVSPHLRLVSLGVRFFLDPDQPRSRDQYSLRPASWRGGTHWLGFHLAGSVERCLPGYRRRLAPDHLADVYAAFSKLAMALRRTCIYDMENEDNRQRFALLVRYAVSLVAAKNPVVVAGDLAILLADEQPVDNTRRMRSALESVSSQLQGLSEPFESLRKIVVATLIVGAVVWFLANGNLGELFKLR